MPTLASLQRDLRPAAEWLLAYGRSLDRSLRLTSARRTWAEQARLYARYTSGRSLLPAAPPGQSLHEYGLAFDLARVGQDPYSDPLLAELGAVWSELGGFWSPSDPVHFSA